MNKLFKVVSLSMVILGTVVVSGCSTNAKINQISENVKVLDQKVETLKTQVKEIQDETAQAKEDAERANARLDNAEQIVHYKK